ncbi:DsbA family protein [Streptomyces sp. NBC_00378]|uniref:DsbA family protein n=1 Tax=unclassified Streptomyces TaxID=2593676 RepID=UPI00224E1A9E|nr:MULTISPECIES: DsbA family protein [unclassified Streptomyces]MCX5113462.1 DsbA family protein [Streptomyces sp. NBC_00378]
MAAARLTYAYCGWCYGFGQAPRQLAAENADRIELRVLSGGIFSGPRALPVSAYLHIPGANQRIADLTGVTFGDGYRRMLDEGSTVMDSAAATVLAALHRQAPERALELAGALQRAWYIDGRSLSDVEVHWAIAAEHGLDADAFLDPTTRAEAEDDFRELRPLGVDAYPTLLLHTPTGTHRLGGPVSSAASLTEGLDRHLAPAA